MSDVWSPPQAPLDTPNSTDEAYAMDMRQRHINHETSVKSIGTLYYFVAALLVLGALFAIFSDGLSSAQNAILAVVAIGFGALLGWLGRGLKQLKAWARIPAGVLSGIGLIGFPIWTIINSYILYLLFSQKGAMVFSEEYKQIIADTPIMRARTSIIVWIFLALLVASIVFTALAARSH